MSVPSECTCFSTVRMCYIVFDPRCLRNNVFWYAFVFLARGTSFVPVLPIATIKMWYFNARVSAYVSYFFQLLLRSYNYYMHFEGPLPNKLCLVASSSLEQCQPFEIFRLQHVQMTSTTLRFDTKLIGNKADVCRINRNTLWGFTSPRSTQEISHYQLLLG